MAAAKVVVPQSGGVVKISVGQDTIEYKVTSEGVISPRNNEERDLLLRYVPGAKLATAQEGS